MITPLPGAWLQKPGSATFPFFGVQPIIVDEKGVEIEGECSGYLCIKSSWPGAFRTLYGDHERYETTYFKPFPGYYFTGDGCSRDKDGYHWLTGRVDDVINVSGHRIGTAEVESALVSHPKCAEAAVVGVEHEVKGQGIYAFVTLVEGEPYSEELRKGLILTVRKQRDEEDMSELVRNCLAEFKEYYIQMQAAKRSQAPLPSQVKDDRIILDKTVADQVSLWKSSKGFTDALVLDHVCSGETCSYHQIGDVFVCEKTGNVHVCDETCRETVMDPANELLVCKISGHCLDRLLSAAEMETDAEQQQGGVTDEAEPFMGSGRFARAYVLGYNCADERELDAVLRFC